MNNSRRLIFGAAMLIPALLLAYLELFPPVYSENAVLDGMFAVIVTRSLGFIVFFILSLYMGYNIFGLTDCGREKYLLYTLVPLAVVVNNLPIIGLLTGNAYLTSPGWYIAIYAFEALMIGLFEEFAFRGVLLPVILEKRLTSSRSIFLATVVSSALFGLVHIVNLFSGGSPIGVLQQIGYSFLIGGMCAIVLLYTRCIWICVVLHAVYDFCGRLVPTLGEGIIWDRATIVITVILALFAFVFMIIWLLRITPEKAQELFDDRKKQNDDNKPNGHA